MEEPDKRLLLYQPDDKTGPYLLVLHVAPVGNRLECVGVEMRSYVTPEDIAEPTSERFAERLSAALPLIDGTPGRLRARPPNQEPRAALRVDGILQWPIDDAKPVTTDALRVALGPLMAETRKGAAEALRHLLAEPPSPEEAEAMRERARLYEADRRSGRGRPRLSFEELEEVARLYREALAKGEWPNQYIAKKLPISVSTAKARVWRARKAGLIGPTVQGRAGEYEPGEQDG